MALTLGASAGSWLAEKISPQSMPNPARHVSELGDLLVAYLEQLGVDYVFGVPGGPIEPFYNALARSERRGGPRAVVARHETGAAFMADGYARNSGKLGVCCGTVGPGTTNLITGVASAYDNHSAMLVISAQTGITHFGRGATQESADTGINTVAMFSHCTHYSSLVSHVDQFEQKLMAAVSAAVKSPCGPSHLSIPVDVMRTPMHAQPTFDLHSQTQTARVVDYHKVAELTEKLLASRKPVLLVGEGAVNCIDDVLALALKLDAAIITTPHGKGLISPYHPKFRGVIGFCGHQSAIDLISDTEVDLVVAIGTTLQETATNAWSVLNVINHRMVHVDENETNLIRSPLAQLHVLGNLPEIFVEVHKLLHQQQQVCAETNDTQDHHALTNLQDDAQVNFEQQEADKIHADSIPIKPQRLMHLLPKMLPPQTRYLCDSGNSMAWSIHYLHPHDRRLGNRRSRSSEGRSDSTQRRQGRRDSHGGIFWTCLEFGSMGWAIGSAIGTALARPNTPTVCITGDGSVLMSGGDITVALQEQLNIVFVILNDSEYGMVKHGQRLGSGEPIGYTLPEIDFVKWAESMSIDAYKITSSAELEELDWPSIVAQPGPIILDVMIDREEVPPIQNRIQALGALES